MSADANASLHLLPPEFRTEVFSATDALSDLHRALQWRTKQYLKPFWTKEEANTLLALLTWPGKLLSPPNETVVFADQTSPSQIVDVVRSRLSALDETTASLIVNRITQVNRVSLALSHIAQYALMMMSGLTISSLMPPCIYAFLTILTFSRCFTVYVYFCLCRCC